MKKLYRYLLMTVLALCLSIPAIAAEAATVAVLPLLNKVEGRTDVSQVYYSGAINAIKAQQGFMMVDNDDLTAVVEKLVTVLTYDLCRRLKILHKVFVNFIVYLTAGHRAETDVFARENVVIAADLLGVARDLCGLCVGEHAGKPVFTESVAKPFGFKFTSA